MEISFQLRNGFDLPPRGHALSKDGHYASPRGNSDESKREPSPPPDTPRAQGTSPFADRTWNTRQQMDGPTVGMFGLCLAIATHVPVGNSGGRDFIQSEI
jgi:hypothetical protein